MQVIILLDAALLATALGHEVRLPGEITTPSKRVRDALCRGSASFEKLAAADLAKRIGFLQARVARLRRLQSAAGADANASGASRGDATDMIKELKSKFEILSEEEGSVAASLVQVDRAVDSVKALSTDNAASGLRASAAADCNTARSALNAVSALATLKQRQSIGSFLRARFTGTCTAQAAEMLGMLRDIKGELEASPGARTLLAKLRATCSDIAAEYVDLRASLNYAPSPAPAPSPSGQLPSVTVMDNGSIDKCPTGGLIPLAGATKVTEGECSQMVQLAQIGNKCGGLYMVKTNAAAPGPACSCCSPVPKKDCTNCLAGGASVGWQTRPSTNKAIGWKVMRLAFDAKKRCDCATRAYAAWGAMSTYKDGMETLGGPMPRDKNFYYMMQMAFWKNVGSWSPKNLTETDQASLWDRKGDCILAFRGEDSAIDFANSKNQQPINYNGLKGVFQGVAQELDTVLRSMTAGNAMALIRMVCVKSITVSGHSLGGGVSQLFTALANKIGDPLNAGITVDYHYGFGAMPVGLSEFADDKHPGGCFPGGLYYNMQKDASGNSFIDILSFRGNENGYKWLKAPKVLTWNYSEKKVFSCETKFPPVPAYKGLPGGAAARLSLHDAAQYVDNVGCKDNSGLLAGRVPAVKPGPAGLIIGAKSIITQCPKGANIPVATNPSSAANMSLGDCAQLVRSKKAHGICGDLFAVKVGPDSSAAGEIAPPYTPVLANSPAAAPPTYTTCSCCAPTPPVSCLTCIAGSGNFGWQTAPAVASKGNWATMLLTDNMPKASTCVPAAAASWAAMSAYRSSPLWIVGIPYVANYEFMLKSAFWTLRNGWIATNTSGADNDYAELYVKGGDCMLAFRGSDSSVDHTNLGIFPGSPSPAPAPAGAAPAPASASYYGLSLNPGVETEWKFMAQRLAKVNAFTVIKKTCTNPLTVVGHSLGAALAQMFAVMANQLGDPLNMGLTVGDIYGFGAVPIGKELSKAGLYGEPTNQKRADGCFRGGLYGNANARGDTIDPAFTAGMGTNLGYRHVRATKYIMWAGRKKVIKCGGPVTYQNDFKTDTSLMPLHDYALYTSNVGC